MIGLIRLQTLLLLCLLTTGVNGADDSIPPAAQGDIDFETQIAPIFSERCLDCHGDADQESNLRLDRKSSLLRGGDSGEPAIILGKSGESHLIKLVAGLEPDLAMPPDDDPLTDEQIGLLRAWIDQGAVWPGPQGEVNDTQLTSDHWAFQPLEPIPVPELDSSWVRNPIDAFILQRLKQEGLAPNPLADRATLIRRMELDVLGLPPTPQAVESLINDRSPTAVDDLIESVLQSPHYGERRARHWLDLVRFAETHGFETNRERPHAWRYRDYVIESLNNDKPYDQFLREQIAGDTYGNPVALGYLVAGPYDLVKSPDINLTLMQRQNELDDMINTTGTAFVGLTIGCARCHNHKFDPITQADYYSMQAIFAGVNHGDMPLPLDSGRETRLAEIDRSISELRNQLEPYFRESVSARGNLEAFGPQPAKFVRFTIQATNSSEPCLDELEIYSNGDNVALASRGAKATASGTLPGFPIHQLKHINDGRPGNNHSWISNENGKGWIQIELAEPHVIDSIQWARDRSGNFTDRVATQYVIESSQDGSQWTTIASSADRLPLGVAVAADELVKHFRHLTPEDARQAQELYEQLQTLQTQRDRLTTPPQAYAGNYSQPGPTHRLYRGEATAKREEVPPDVPDVFADLKLPLDAPEQQRRKALADWIASAENPLTARVIVNRIWQFHFGQAIVATPSDFGEGGVPPTHPELLDWLASELIAHDWSLKHIHRLILQSSTYQQTSTPNPEGLKVDGSSQLLWRFPPRRLAAEPIRDSILSVTGVLDLAMGGPGFSAFDVEAENVRHYHPKTSYGPSDWRRMIYMTKVRMEQDAVFGLFDCPDAATSVPERSRSTTPLQALNLFNSQFLMQQAELFANRLQQDAPSGVPAQIERAYHLCYARSPSPDEQQLAESFVRDEGLIAFCRAVLNSNEFLFIQ